MNICYIPLHYLRSDVCDPSNLNTPACRQALLKFSSKEKKFTSFRHGRPAGIQQDDIEFYRYVTVAC